jgi:hypothetical protein
MNCVKLVKKNVMSDVVNGKKVRGRTSTNFKVHEQITTMGPVEK